MARKPKWFEHYKCGCVSDIVEFKKDLLGYCPRHGSDRKMIYPVSKQKPRPKAKDA